MQSWLERAFVEPFLRLADQMALVVAPLITVLIVLVIGGAVAFVARHIVYRILVARRFDTLVAQTGFASTVERTRIFRSPSDFGARLVQGVLWLFIVLLALNAAGAEMTQAMVASFVAYIPNLVFAALVLLLGSVLSKFLARSALLAAVNAQWPGARLIAGSVRVLVMLVAVLVALEQLRIGRSVLLVTFAILFGGIVIAAAIAFGLGARDLAREWMQSKLRPKEGDREDEEVLRHL